MPHTDDHPRPALTVDCVVFGLDEQDLKVLLVRRDVEPFAGRWALPGGFVRMEESLEQAARRELAEETGLSRVFLEQLYTFGEVGRDPRGRVVTVAYYALMKLGDRAVRAATDAGRAAWFALDQTPPLAFDHDRILAMARQRLRGKLRYQPVGFALLPSKFTLTQLQRLYEQVLERRLDKRNFRRRVLGMGILQEVGQVQTGVAHRAAKLYRFEKQHYDALMKRGFHFEI